MRKIRQVGAMVWLLAGVVTTALGMEANVLEQARDLAADGRLVAAKRMPLLILYSQDDCSWCEKLKREYLGPMSRDPAVKVLIRELHMDHATPLIDFEGRRTTSADFSRRVKARFAPTVMFHGPDGASLAEPIVGFLLADFYGAYLERAINESRSKLKTKH
ncbi:MAG: hypothetical protein K9J42_05655 [Sulfuritalea sp.]|nr:hypothetical protein [Sulfuritalea sp.]